MSLAELLSGLSMVADIGMGLEPGEAGRATLVAIELADAVDADSPADVYYTTLLQHVGCTAYAHEAAALLGGDEIAVKRAAVHTDFASPRDVLRNVPSEPRALLPSLVTRVRAAGTAAVRGREIVQGYSRSNCEVAARTAERVGLSQQVRRALLDVYEQWNGKGGPTGIAGEQIAGRHGSRRSRSPRRCSTASPVALQRSTPLRREPARHWTRDSSSCSGAAAGSHPRRA